MCRLAPGERALKRQPHHVSTLVQLLERLAAHHRRHRQMQRPSQTSRKAPPQLKCCIERDVDVHVTDSAALGLEHSVRREVAQPAPQRAEGSAERRRDHMDGKVAVDVDPQHRSEPSHGDGVRWQTAERKPAHEQVAERNVLRVQAPLDGCADVKPGRNRACQLLIPEALGRDAHGAHRIHGAMCVCPKRVCSRCTRRDQHLAPEGRRCPQALRPVLAHCAFELSAPHLRSSLASRCAVVRGLRAHAHHQLQRGLERVAQPRKRSQRRDAPRRVDLLDVQLPGADDGGALTVGMVHAFALDHIRTDGAEPA